MSDKLEPTRILWAIDPFETETRPDPLSLATLLHWRHAAGAVVQPVYVLNLERDDDPSVAHCDHERVRGARKAAIRFLSALSAEWAEKPMVLTERGASPQASVERLLRYASMEGADLIAVSSHGRSGLTRAAIGSFAEGLLKRSPVPVIFLSHGNEAATADLSHAFFATDLSQASRRAFERFVSDARHTSLRLTLFHQSSRAAAEALLIYPPALMPYMTPPEAERIEAEARAEIDRWAQWAKSKGVETSVIVSQELGDTAKLIRSLARERGAGMIGVATQSGDLAAFLLGSVARGVFREHELPVWACGPEFDAPQVVPERRQESVVTGDQEVS